MSLSIRKSTYEDIDGYNTRCTECDCSSPDAVIESENVKIPICEKCIPVFIHKCFNVLKEIGNTCQKCRYFKPCDDDDWKQFGGSCDVKRFGWHSLNHSEKACEMFSRRDDKNE